MLRLEIGKDLEDACELEEEIDQYIYLYVFACRQRPLQYSRREFWLLQMVR